VPKLASLAAILLVLVLAACGGGGGDSSNSSPSADTSTPEGTVEAFYQAILDGNPTDACALLTEQGNQLRLLLPGLTNWVPPGNVAGGLQAKPCEEALADPSSDDTTTIEGLVKTIKPKQESGTSAEVEVTEEGALVPSGILLVKEGAQWKINEPSLGSANR
jgi:hypothetical protein